MGSESNLSGERFSTSQEISEKAGIKTVFWDFLSLASSNLVLIPLGLLSSILSVRILGREGYGRISLFMMVVGVLLLLASNWSLAAVLRFGREEYDKTDKLRKTFWARNILLFPSLLVVLSLCFFCRDAIAGYIQMPSWTLWLLAASVLISAWGGYLDYLLQASHRMGSYAAIQVVRSVVVIIGLVLILLWPFEKNYINVVIAGLCGGIAVLILAHLKFPAKTLLPVETNREMLREVFLYSYPVIVGNIAAYMVDWIDALVIKHYFQVADVGGYQVAYNVFNLLAGLLGSVAILTTPILISFKTAGREDLIVHYGTRLVPQSILFLAVLIGMAMSLFPLVFSSIYGQEFRVSGGYFQFLAFGLVINVPLFFLSGVFAAYNWMKLNMVICVARALMKLVADLLLVPLMGPLGATVANIISIALVVGAYLVICQRRWGIPLLWQEVLALPALLSLASCLFLPHLWALFVGPGLAIASGYGLAKSVQLFKADDIAFLKYVKMPAPIRRGMVWVYTLLAT